MINLSNETYYRIEIECGSQLVSEALVEWLYDHWQGNSFCVADGAETTDVVIFTDELGSVASVRRELQPFVEMIRERLPGRAKWTHEYYQAFLDRWGE